MALFIVPFIGQFVIMGTVMSLGDPELMIVIMPIITLLFMALFIGWLYILGTSLYTKLPPNDKMNIKFFKFNIHFVIVYSLVFMANTTTLDGLINFGVLFIFHLYSIYCMFYGLYFVSKALVSIEKQQEAVLGDFLGTFFMFWFFPIGIWAIQPKVKKIFS